MERAGVEKPCSSGDVIGTTITSIVCVALFVVNELYQGDRAFITGKVQTDYAADGWHLRVLVSWTASLLGFSYLQNGVASQARSTSVCSICRYTSKQYAVYLHSRLGCASSR
jgi:hypothetical protein